MIKKEIYRGDLKARLKASAKDRLHRFILSDGMVRGAVVNSTRMVNEMNANHELGHIETLILGQTYIAAALLTANLKGRDRISIHIECSGPLKGLDVEANAFGEVRGYLKNPTFSKNLSGKETCLSSFFGAGFLTVTKYLEDAKRPYSGKIMLEYGNIAEDIANYFLKSEQTPTAFSLSVHFDEHEATTSDSDSRESLNKHLIVDGAGGLFLQAMPGADSSVVAEVEDIMRQVIYPRIPPLSPDITTSSPSTPFSLGAAFVKNIQPEHLILEKFESMTPILLGNQRVEFFCRCNQKTIQGYISRLPQDELTDIAQNGPFPLEIRCHHCNTFYHFTQSDIQGMIS